MQTKTITFFKWMACVALVFTLFSISSCSKDDEKNLKGTSWSMRSSSAGKYDFTYTIRFTTEKEATYNQKGWGMVGSKKQTYDDTKTGTYVYYPEIQEGWIDCSAFSGGKLVFAISGNELSSKTSSTVYTKN